MRPSASVNASTTSAGLRIVMRGRSPIGTGIGVSKGNAEGGLRQPGRRAVSGRGDGRVDVVRSRQPWGLRGVRFGCVPAQADHHVRGTELGYRLPQDLAGAGVLDR